MTKKNNKKTIVPAVEQKEQKFVFTPAEDLQIIMQGGETVSVIVPIEEFNRMETALAIAEEQFEGKNLLMPDGTKVTFHEMIEKRVEAEAAEHEAALNAMFAEYFDHEDDEEQN